MTTQSNSVEASLASTLSQLPRWAQIVFGIIGCAIVAHYAPSTVNAVFFGKFRSLVSLLDIAVMVSTMSVASLVGLRLRREWLVAVVLATLYALYTALILLRMPKDSVADLSWIPSASQPFVSILLNAWLLRRYKAKVLQGK